MRAPEPVPRERIPGGTALDGLDPRDTREAARASWRDVIYRITRIDLGRIKGSAYELGLRDQIRTPVGGAFPIAVLNLKGGVGKTVVVEALGSTFADVRDDRVIAVDIDGGDLSDRHGRRSRLSMVDLVRDCSVTRYVDVRAHTFMNSSGLEVLGLPEYANTHWRLERPDVVKVFSILRKHYSVVLVDCVKALKSSVMEAVLPEAQALVVVSSASIDAVRKTRTTLEWLRNNGYQKLVGSTVLAINHTEPAQLGVLSGKELERLSALVAATVVLPFDRHVHEGKEIGLDRLSRKSRRCYLEMAAALAEMFPSGGRERRQPVGAHSPSR
ncbi:MinD/ParA family ATP-binding protein [Mycobacterium riyadhense]|uniref:CobQ/CobB/MinD/ParA nucleotide binding domain protein n=1 Tax=Mycobacterium riyadhense TaxID=486698 RepID=A0A653ENI5_9MYCO|nr:MinD/ParA family protein [Mycobacterium riyadhense]VTO98852.1 CobQ/CobB/MinD/ParA nucleotide binding domain protein [Mycobacterium riyadhense]